MVRKLWALLLCTCLMLTGCGSKLADVGVADTTLTAKDLQYVGLTEDTIDWVIPETYVKQGKVYHITEIEDLDLEEYRSLRSVEIPEGVIEIGEAAFRRSSIESVTLPTSLQEIGYGAFSHCEQLKGIELPEGLTRICPSAFNSCKSLVTITLPASLKELAGHALSGCTSLEGVYVEDGNAVYADIEGALYNKALTVLEYLPPMWTSYAIPEGTLEISEDALDSYCALQDCYLPASLGSDQGEKFIFCHRLERVTVSEDNPYYTAVDGSLYSKNLTKLLVVPRTCTTYRIRDGVRTVGYTAFGYSRDLKSCWVPRSVVMLEDGAAPGRELDTIYYEGTEEEWEALKLVSGNYNQTFWEATNIFFECVDK